MGCIRSLAFLLLLLAPCGFAAPLNGITVQPPAPSALDSVTLQIRGELPNPCFSTPVATAVVRGQEITVNITTAPLQTFAPCIQVIQPFTASVTLGRLAAGVYTATYTLLIDGKAADTQSAQFTVTPGGSAPDGMILVGSMAQVASGGGWTTTFTVVNPDPYPVMVRLAFFDDNGEPLPLPLKFPVENASATGATVERTIPGGASLIVETNGENDQSPRVGWAQLLRQPSMLAVVYNVSGFAVFRGKSGAIEQEAIAPLQSANPTSWVVAFDNANGHVTGIAIANAAAKPGDIAITVRDADGAEIGAGKLTLAAHAHRVLLMHSEFPQTAGLRGTIEFQRASDGQISVFGLRAGPSFSLSSVPPIER